MLEVFFPKVCTHQRLALTRIGVLERCGFVPLRAFRWTRVLEEWVVGLRACAELFVRSVLVFIRVLVKSLTRLLITC